LTFSLVIVFLFIIRESRRREYGERIKKL
jgi:hypothetical protein